MNRVRVSFSKDSESQRVFCPLYAFLYGEIDERKKNIFLKLTDYASFDSVLNSALKSNSSAGCSFYAAQSINHYAKRI